ncbi:MAG: patatin-like phospholipase family protein [Pyrinomonadaceae bacterium]
MKDEKINADTIFTADAQIYVDKPSETYAQSKAEEQAVADKQRYLDEQSKADAQMLAEKQQYLDQQSTLAMPDGKPSDLKQPSYEVMIAATDASQLQAPAPAGDIMTQPGLEPEPPGGSSSPLPATDPGIFYDPNMPGGSPSAVDPTTVIDPSDAEPFITDPTVMDPSFALFEPVGIALSGGGTIGDFELGALDFIHREFLGKSAGISAGFPRSRADVATGTSVGAVNAGAIAQGGVHCVDDLKKIWFDMTATSDFYIFNAEIKKLIPNQGEQYGSAVARIVNDILIGLFLTKFVPLGFLYFLAADADVRKLYEVIMAQRSVMEFGKIGTIAADIERYWSPAGPGLRGSSIAVARDGHGRRIVFARAYDDMLYARWQLDNNPISRATRWSRWTSLGGPVSSDPVSYVTGVGDNPSRIGVIARLANEEQYGGRTLDYFNDVRRVDERDPVHYRPFLEWENVPLPVGPIRRRYSSQPTIVPRGASGQAMAFCRDENRRMEGSTEEYNHSYFSMWDGDRWNGWTMFGRNQKRIAGNITGCSYWDGSLELFARTENFGILYSFVHGNGAPGDWVNWDGEATSDVLVVQTEAPDEMLDLFWRGTDGQVWTRRKLVMQGQWGSVHRLGGLITSNLSFGRDVEGICTIFARDLDDNLYAVRQPSPSAEWPADAWEAIGAPDDLHLIADPYTLAGANDGIEVYVVASDHAVWTIRQRYGAYGPWVSLGGNVWTGTQLRMGSVALETGESRYVDETGRFAGSGGPIVSSNGNMAFARSQGALAACSAPGVFPPITLNDNTLVDGGVRNGVPIAAAIEAGARRVIAIATVPTKLGSVTPILPRSLTPAPMSLAEEIAATVGQFRDSDQINDYRNAGVLDVTMRSFIEILVDSTSWNSLYPATPWVSPTGTPVPVSLIQQTFKTHEGGTVDPGLIRINYSYGWMRAFDSLVASDAQREEAKYWTDTIINLRWNAWKAEARFREAHFRATWSAIPPTHDADAIVQIAMQAALLAKSWLLEARGYKIQLAAALTARRAAGFPIDPESPLWLARVERFAIPEHWPWFWPDRIASSDELFSEFTFVTLGYSRHVIHVVEAGAPPSFDSA